MLPFLKNKEGSASSPVEVLEREPDESSEYGTLDAVVDDFATACGVAEEKKGLLKSALEALVEHIQGMDKQQDQGVM